MFKHQLRVQRSKDLGFEPIHNNSQQETCRLCSKCGKLITVIELGFCRYRFVEISYFIEYESIASPCIIIVRKYANHNCRNNENIFHVSKSKIKEVHKISNNSKELLSDVQSTKPIVMEVM